MRAPSIDPLTPFEKSTLQADARAILDDAQVKVEVTLTGLSSVDYDADTGTHSRTTPTAETVNAVRKIVGPREAAGSAVLEVGDRIYLVDQADVTASVDSYMRVTDGSDKLEIQAVDEDVLGMLYRIQARKA